MKKEQLALERQRQQEYDMQLHQVRELELKARYWKAQHDIRLYTLEAENLQGPYDEYVAAQKVKNEKAQKEFQEMLAKMKLEGAKVEESPEMIDVVIDQLTLDLNPQFVEEGLKIGDTIQIPKVSDVSPEEEKTAMAELQEDHPELFSNG